MGILKCWCWVVACWLLISDYYWLVICDFYWLVISDYCFITPKLACAIIRMSEPRLHNNLDVLQCTENVVSWDRYIKPSYDVTLASIISGIIQGLSIFGKDFFCTLERIESNQPYYTTLVLLTKWDTSSYTSNQF